MKMKAIVLKDFGGVENLAMEEWDVPEPGAGDVRIKVSAASINPVDFKTRKGFLGGELPMVLGVDLAGVVDAVGEGVTDVSVGDEVYAFVYAEGPASNGAYAEYVVTPAAFVANKPKPFSFPESAAMAMVGLTAYQCMVDKARVKEGDSVFIAGGSGAVGMVGIQLARHLGADPVLTTAGSDESLAYLRDDLGIPEAQVLRYKGLSVPEMAEIVQEMNGGDLVNATFDFVGGDMKDLCSRIVDFDGHVTTIVEEPEDYRLYLTSGERSPMLAKSASFHFELCLARARFGGPKHWPIFGDELRALGELIDAGRIKPHKIILLDSFSVDAVQDAHERLEGRHVGGKLVMGIG
jgi:NADPH2:quinone reductase